MGDSNNTKENNPPESMTEEDLQEAFVETAKHLPEAIRKFITADRLKAEADRLKERYQLSDEQHRLLKDETLYVIIGWAEQSEYSKNLQSHARIDESTAEKIAQEVTERVFNILPPSSQYTLGENSMDTPPVPPSEKKKEPEKEDPSRKESPERDTGKKDQEKENKEPLETKSEEHLPGEPSTEETHKEDHREPPVKVTLDHSPKKQSDTPETDKKIGVKEETRPEEKGSGELKEETDKEETPPKKESLREKVEHTKPPQREEKDTPKTDTPPRPDTGEEKSTTDREPKEPDSLREKVEEEGKESAPNEPVGLREKVEKDLEKRGDLPDRDAILRGIEDPGSAHTHDSEMFKE